MNASDNAAALATQASDPARAAFDPLVSDATLGADLNLDVILDVSVSLARSPPGPRPLPRPTRARAA